MGKLHKKVVFITGGNSGIGKAAALEAAREGATVVVADLATVDHAPTIQELTALGVPALFVPIDVSDVESVKKAITATVEKFGRLDVALNYGDQHIRANAICPYYIDTPLLGTLPPEIRKGWEDGTPMKRLGTAEEVAKAFIYFASDDSSYCNGSILTLDGGVLAGG